MAIQNAKGPEQSGPFLFKFDQYGPVKNLLTLLNAAFVQSESVMTQKILYTIGYEGADLGAFLVTLKAHNIKQIIDVRELPLSRKRGFSKNALATALEISDINYLHLKALGDPKSGREAARSGDIARFRRIYLDHLSSDHAQGGLANTLIAAKKMTSSLLCYERNHADCHRSIIAEKLKVDFRVIHITVPILASEKKNDANRVAATFALG